MADVESALPSPEEIASRAVQWLLRGATWQALAREIAWTAVQSAGANYAAIEWLTPLVEARLGETVDGLEFAVDMASAGARGEHVRRRPGDLTGASRTGTAHGYDEAVQRLSTLYVEELRWALEVVEARLDRRGRRRRARYTPWAVARRRPATDPELPREVAAAFERSARRLGSGSTRRDAA